MTVSGGAGPNNSSETAAVRTRRTVPVIAPTEWIEYQPEHAVLVAEWLAERGVECEVLFGRATGPTLWRPTGMGRDSLKAGQWIGVRGGSTVVAGEDELDDATRYRDVTAVFTEPTTRTEVVTP